MDNFDMPWEKEYQPQAKVTPITCGTPTKEEEEEAFERLFQEFWRNHK